MTRPALIDADEALRMMILLIVFMFATGCL